VVQYFLQYIWYECPSKRETLKGFVWSHHSHHPDLSRLLWLRERALCQPNFLMCVCLENSFWNFFHEIEHFFSFSLQLLPNNAFLFESFPRKSASTISQIMGRTDKNFLQDFGLLSDCVSRVITIKLGILMIINHFIE
jgi:hypothetical protein